MEKEERHGGEKGMQHKKPIVIASKKARKISVKPWAIDFIAVVFILRGIVNLFTTFDELYFIGSTTQSFVHIISIIAGIGIILRLRWGFYLGLIIAIIMFIFHGDNNTVERLLGRLISITIFLGLIKVKSLFQRVNLFDKLISLIAILVLIVVQVYDSVQLSEYEVYRRYTTEAIDRGDYTVCNKIASTNFKEMCYLSVNEKITDSSICDMLSNEDNRDVCFLNLAKAKLDLLYCEKIKRNYSKNFCINYVKNH
ncbi:MAG: hypothetical protein QW802_03425 [Candidatus Altiarchaeota archaeon]